MFKGCTMDTVRGKGNIRVEEKQKLPTKEVDLNFYFLFKFLSVLFRETLKNLINMTIRQ